MEGVVFADKGISTVKILKSFGQAFLKACAVEGAEPSSPSAEGEISYTAFLFASFFFAPTVAKEKAAKEFQQFNKRYPTIFFLEKQRKIH